MGLAPRGRFRSTPPRGGRPNTILIWGNKTQFRSTPPRGGRQPAPHVRLMATPVSIHAPARGATQSNIIAGAGPTGFDPRPRAGGDLTQSKPMRPQYVFRSTPPRGGRHHSLRSLKMVLCFDPRPRAGGDDTIKAYEAAIRVSIHAPARGATCAAGTTGGMVAVSIHAPARGATHPHGKAAVARVFRSTPPRGGRPVTRADVNAVRMFRSTPPRGGRRWVRSRMDHSHQFRSTPPRGGRQHAKGYAHRRLCFDPRPRAGGDTNGTILAASRRVSIHAPARGATKIPTSRPATLLFRSTPPRGGRLNDLGFALRATGFDPRPRAGGDFLRCF